MNTWKIPALLGEIAARSPLVERMPSGVEWRMHAAEPSGEWRWRYCYDPSAGAVYQKRQREELMDWIRAVCKREGWVLDTSAEDIESPIYYACIAPRASTHADDDTWGEFADDDTWGESEESLEHAALIALAKQLRK